MEKMADATFVQREMDDAVVDEDASDSPRCLQKESEITLKTEEGWAVSSSTSSAACAACLRVFTLTKTGLVRTHGPIDSHCRGSRVSPASIGVAPHTPSFSQLANPSSPDGCEVESPEA